MKKDFIDKKLATKLLDEYGSPLYVYKEDILKIMANKMSTFLDGHGIKYKCHYAMKANSNPHLLKIIREEGLLVDSMSPGELAMATKAGFTNKEILYVCNNILEEEMKEVADKNILMVFDSISQIETFGKIYQNKDIMVRINPGVTGIGHSIKVITAGDKTKFGISEDLFEELNEVVKKYNLRIIGIHQHLGSLFLNDKIDNYIVGVKKLLKLATFFPNLKTIDLGGGFGIPYKPDEEELNFDLLNAKLVPILKDFISSYGEVEFIFEPGRIVIGASGIILGKITAKKKNMKTNYIGTDIGMGILERPSRYESYHHIEVLNDNSNTYTATVVGNVCESGDILGENRDINIPSVNDPIVIYDVGAYGMSMASNYTLRTRPAEILISEDGVKLIRKKESIEDLLNMF